MENKKLSWELMFCRDRDITSEVRAAIKKVQEEEREKFINELKILINKRELAEIDNSIYYKKEYGVNEDCIDELENLIKKLKGEKIE